MYNSDLDNDDTLVYYSKDRVTQVLRKNTKYNARNYLYSVCAIIDKAIYIVNMTKSVLPEKDIQEVEKYITELTVKLPKLVKSIDKKKEHCPNSNIKSISIHNVELFSRFVHVDILTNDYLTYNRKMAHILHNVMLFVTLAISIIGYVANDPEWEEVNDILGSLILVLDKDYNDTLKEATSVYNYLYKNMLQLYNNEDVVYVDDWDSILRNFKESEEMNEL